MTASPPSPEAGADSKAATAQWETGPPGGECTVKVGGDWQLSDPVPNWSALLDQRAVSDVRITPQNLGKWDTSLVLFLVHGRAWCVASKHEFHAEALPDNLQKLLQQVAEVSAQKPKPKASIVSPLVLAGSIARKWTGKVTEVVAFVGECTLGFAGLVRNPGRFRWMDWLVQMQQCWVTSLPIVGLVSFLVGVILAFQAALQLRQFGAAIFVADVVGLTVVREMGPMMASMIVAGGTGAGFAAQLGNMKVDEEIDALETLGISSVNFLALPRLLAVTVMMPILVVYANVLGILGGMFVSAAMLDIPASAYWIETQERVGVSDVTSGLVKSVFFGIAIGLAGCLRGMKCDRSASGVGTATSSAVVTGMMLIVLADAVFALIYNVLGI